MLEYSVMTAKESGKKIGFVREYDRMPNLGDDNPFRGVEMMGTFEEWDAIYNDFDILRTHGYRAGAARRLGLPEDSSWDDIERFVDEQERQHYIQRYKLPETATRDEIDSMVGQDQSLIPVSQKGYAYDQDELLRNAASALGVTYSATWVHIFNKAVMIGVNSQEEFINRLLEIEAELTRHGS